jgi:hypothetical protein
MRTATIGLTGVGIGVLVTEVANMPGGRHHITNLVLRVDGDRATARAWAAPPGNPAW